MSLRGLTALLAAGALMGGAFLAGLSLGGRQEAIATVVTNPDPLTVRLERRPLEIVQVASAELRYERLGTVRGSGGTVTWLAAPGDILDEGDPAVAIDLEPVPLLTGETPMFRTLRSRVRGPDVRQLQEALARLGYDPGDTDGNYGPGTRDAWRRLSEDLGVARRTEVAADDVFFVPSLPARVGEVRGELGAAASGELLTLTSPSPKLVATLAADGAFTVADVDRVEVIAGQWRADATVVAVTAAGASGIEVELTVSGEIPVGPPLRVRFVTVVGKNGLVAPATAVYTDPSGGTYVKRWDGVRVTDVPAEIVASSDGEVVLSGALEDGDELLIGRQ